MKKEITIMLENVISFFSVRRKELHSSLWCSALWGGVFVAGVVLIAVVYSYFSCYKDRRFYYMLLHKDAR